METVIGLAPSGQNEDFIIHHLTNSGFDEEKIEVITQASAVDNVVNINRNEIVVNYAILGALIGVSIYGTFAFVAGWCECQYFNFSKIILYEILILGILVGIIIGGIIGGLTGMAKYEGVTHLYTRGISLGERLFVLKTDPDNLETAKKVLQKNGCIGIQSFTESKPASPAADTYDAA